MTDDLYRMLLVRRCPVCDQDAPHEQTDTHLRCLACGADTEREET